jgi:hypothetical protein
MDGVLAMISARRGILGWPHCADAPVSYNDPSGIDYSALHESRRFLDRYPALARALEKTVIDEYALLYKRTGSDPNLKPVVLTAHMDVVRSSEINGQRRPSAGTLSTDTCGDPAPSTTKACLPASSRRWSNWSSKAIAHGEPSISAAAMTILEFLKERRVRAEVAFDEGLSIREGGASLVKGSPALAGAPDLVPNTYCDDFDTVSGPLAH